MAPPVSGLTPPAVTAGSEHHLPGADVLYSQRCATLFTLAVRDAGYRRLARQRAQLCCIPALGRVILHMLETPARILDGRNAGATGTHVAGEVSPFIRDIVATTPLTVLTTLRLQIAARPCRVKRCR